MPVRYEERGKNAKKEDVEEAHYWSVKTAAACKRFFVTSVYRAMGHEVTTAILRETSTD